MKIDDNGIIREMTAEEIVEMKRIEAEFKPSTEPTAEEQVEMLNKKINELQSIIINNI